ncbi:MAG: M28 family peptidase [Bacteroidales bacterium]|nr:M28 family peptidase [Bacteroidales bacterium]
MPHKLLHILPAALLAATALGLTACKSNKSSASDDAADTATSGTQLTAVKFNADSAYAAIVAQCDFGPRVPNSEAHRQCGDYIVAEFRRRGLEVTEQRHTFTGWDGKSLDGRNIIAAYKPEAEERVVIAAHWDSRPWADADPDSARHREPVMAANDGASGVAVMLELARLLPQLNPAVGIDFVCFDAEDYGAPYWGTGDDQGLDWCLGSQYWAEQALASGYRARYGVLLDMVGGRDARFCYEGFSLRFAEGLVARIWDTAAAVGASSLFVRQNGAYATDDHLSMNQIAGIPTVDIIPYIEGSEHSFGVTWHTTSDTPENISPENLRLVGQTLLQLLSEEM